MLVKTYRDGPHCTGLHIGEANVRRYFSKRAPSIELRLGDLRIQCTLDAAFWEGRPEIQDPRLSEWLEFKVGDRRPGRETIYFTLAPSGPGAFVLRSSSKAHDEAFGADVTQARKVRSEPAFPPHHSPEMEELSVA